MKHNATARAPTAAIALGQVLSTFLASHGKLGLRWFTNLQRGALVINSADATFMLPLRRDGRLLTIDEAFARLEQWQLLRGGRHSHRTPPRTPARSSANDLEPFRDSYLDPARWSRLE